MAGSAELHGKTETQPLLASWYQVRHCSDSGTLTRLRSGTSAGNPGVLFGLKVQCYVKCGDSPLIW